MIAARPRSSDHEAHAHPHARAARDQEAQHHRHDVGHRVDDAVAEVVERDRRGAIAIDDERRVFEHFPRGFDQHRQHEAGARWQASRHEPQQRVEGDTVDDVRERVPVGEMLRVLRAVDDAVPELDVATLADRDAAHGQLDDRRGGDDRDRGRRVDPGWARGRNQPLPTSGAERARARCRVRPRAAAPA